MSIELYWLSKSWILLGLLEVEDVVVVLFWVIQSFCSIHKFLLQIEQSFTFTIVLFGGQ